MRALVSEILARRMPEPPAEFLALQVSRLNEALLVAYSAMSGGNLGAVDRVVKIVRELDRYHGFSAADRRSHTRRIEAKAAGPLALAADRPEMAPQSLERIESAPGNALVPAASNPEDAALRRDPAFAFPLAPAQTVPLTDRLEAPSQEPDRVQSAPGNGRAPIFSSDEAAGLAAPAQNRADARPTDRPEMAPQRLEKIESAPGNGAASDPSDEAIPPPLAASAQDPLAPQDSLAPDAPSMRLIEIPPQALERAQRNDTAPPVAPAFLTVGNLSGVRRPNVRAMPNGVMAC